MRRLPAFAVGALRAASRPAERTACQDRLDATPIDGAGVAPPGLRRHWWPVGRPLIEREAACSQERPTILGSDVAADHAPRRVERADDGLPLLEDTDVPGRA